MKYRIFEFIFNFVIILLTASVVYWSEFLATEPEARVRFPALPGKKVVGLERGHSASSVQLRSYLI
jgi:hypothetical protein